MLNGGTRTVLALAAAVWFVIGAATLGSGYPLVEGGGPNDISDPTARAIVDLGRVVLVGLAILSVSMVDVAWIRAVMSRLSGGPGPRR